MERAKVWLQKMSMEGVKYRLSRRNMSTGEWIFEVTQNDGKTMVEFQVKDPHGPEVDIKLREVQFGYLQQGEAEARARRKARLAQRDAEFPRAVQAGGQWKPDGAPEEYGVTAGSESEALSPDGKGGAGSGDRSTEPSEGGEAVGSEARVAKPDTKRPRRGRKPKSQTSRAD